MQFLSVFHVVIGGQKSVLVTTLIHCNLVEKSKNDFQIKKEFLALDKGVWKRSLVWARRSEKCLEETKEGSSANDLEYLRV